MGFGMPVAEWFRGELREIARDVLLDSRCSQRGYLRRDAVERLIDEHASLKRDHGYRLWALLFLELWFREFVDGGT
jgi:asparagine synthase (glutamine-hydrolysing)